MAQGLIPFTGQLLAASDGRLAGAIGLDGKEYLVGILVNSAGASAPMSAVVASSVILTGGTINNVSVGATTQSTGSFTTLAASSTVSGTGFSTYLASPPQIGTTAPNAVRTSNFQAVSADTSGTPGNATNNNPSGRAAFAAGASTVTITNSNVVNGTKVFISLLNAADATLKYVTVTPGAGAFTVTGNAAATAITTFDYFLVN